MFYIGLKGGLGNQMFQYAFGVAASMESNIPLALDLTNYDNQAARDTERSYLLHHFHTQTPIAKKEEVFEFHTKKSNILRKIKRRLKPQSDYVFNPALLKVKHGDYLEGYWQSEQYFKKYRKTIQHELSLKKPLGAEAAAIADEIKRMKQDGKDTILVHLRRGDYVTNPHAAAMHGAQDMEYYMRGLEHIDKVSEKPKHVFIATDDVEYVKKHFRPHHGTTFISRPGIYDFEEISLMTHCDHFVISNSSFSWWGAWLAKNENKIVVAPMQWVKDPKTPTPDIIPKDWKQV